MCPHLPAFVLQPVACHQQLFLTCIQQFCSCAMVRSCILDWWTQIAGCGIFSITGCWCFRHTAAGCSVVLGFVPWYCDCGPDNGAMLYRQAHFVSVLQALEISSSQLQQVASVCKFCHCASARVPVHCRILSGVCYSMVQLSVVSSTTAAWHCTNIHRRAMHQGCYWFSA